MPGTHRTPVSPLPRPGIRAQDFTDPFTRRLLLNEGSTTELLERRGRCRLGLRVVEQTLAPLHLRDGRLLDMLGVTPQTPCLVRRTELVSPEGTAVSRNLVIGLLPRSDEVTQVVTHHSVALGRSVNLRGIPQRRTLLSAGLTTWQGTGRTVPAVSRGYLLHLDDEAPLYVAETFNPAVAPPWRRGTGTGTGTAAPVSAVRAVPAVTTALGRAS
ncbi:MULTISPECIES: hypothetical protein [Streptomyces]|uniref:hypothetical protein n=1 Tax=Streptomyces TaxID=1883 RepID=UPI00093A1795|nr:MULTISPECIES: hypothetical protein [Streptomyces]OKI42903.1 hypothetical protein A6A28_22455 [Streptomyces sp. CB03578]PJN17632.1 hypothetical protein CG724_18815 [Streptomyces sp. CB02120-2]RPK28868.1 hypothetical protein EES37_36135 [Streptomyces sp. ADI91-18]WSS03541.1 hypothetical protein OG224_36290 [Streptomyces goshikiensis]WSY02678.1 hypothetical protein OG590_36190 [Streptomyces goshikiensis]